MISTEQAYILFTVHYVTHASREPNDSWKLLTVGGGEKKTTMNDREKERGKTCGASGGEKKKVQNARLAL